MAANLDRRPIKVFGGRDRPDGSTTDGFRIVSPDDSDYEREHAAARRRMEYGAPAPYATPEDIEQHRECRARSIALMGEDGVIEHIDSWGDVVLFSEALSGGHWVTIENDEGETHIYIAGGHIKAGPKGLVGHSTAVLHAHAKATGARLKTHKEGVVPTGHNDHPDYHEHQDKKIIHGRWGDGSGIEVDNPLPEKDDKDFATNLKTAQERKALHERVKEQAGHLNPEHVNEHYPLHQQVLTQEHGDEHGALADAVSKPDADAHTHAFAREYVGKYGAALKAGRGKLDEARGVHEQATKAGLDTEHTATLGARLEAAKNQHGRNLMTFNRLKDAVDDADAPPVKSSGDLVRERLSAAHEATNSATNPHVGFVMRKQPAEDIHLYRAEAKAKGLQGAAYAEHVKGHIVKEREHIAKAKEAAVTLGSLATEAGKHASTDEHQAQIKAAYDRARGITDAARAHEQQLGTVEGGLDADVARGDRESSPLHKLVESGQTWDHQHLHQLAVRAEQHQSEHNRHDPDNAENRGRLQKLINLLDSPAYLDKMGGHEPSKDVLHEHVAAVHGLLSAQAQRDTESDQRQAKEMRERFLAHDTGYSPQLTLTRDQREQALGQYVPATGSYGTFHVMKGIARAVSDHENVHDGISSGFSSLAGAVALQHYMGHATSLHAHDDFSDASSKARALQDYIKENKSLPKSQEYFDNITHQEGFNARRRAYQQQQELQKLRDREAEQARHGDDMTEQERATRNQNVSKILAAHASNPSPAVPVTRHGKHELHSEAEQTIQAIPGLYKTLTNTFGGTVHFGSPGARNLPDYVKTAQRKRYVHGTNFTRQRESWSFGKGFEHAKVSRETRAKINDPTSGHYIPEGSPYQARRDYYNNPDNYDWHNSLVAHEYGHLLDDALGHVHGKFGDDRTTRSQGSVHVRRITRSVHDDFSKLYDEHKNNSKLRPYMRENKSEMFAEGFMMHHLRPDELKEAAPSLHAFFEALPDETRKKLQNVQEKYNA